MDRWLRAGSLVQHLEVLEDLPRIALRREVARDHALEQHGQQIGSGVPRRQRRRDFRGVDAVGFSETQRLGDHAVVGKHQRLVDELGRLAGADRRPDASAGRDARSPASCARSLPRLAARHDGERAAAAAAGPPDTGASTKSMPVAARSAAATRLVVSISVVE